MLQFRLLTMFAAVAVCGTLAACSRLRGEPIPDELRAAAPYAAMFLFYGALVVTWSVAYVRAPEATVTLTAVGLSVILMLSLVLCLVLRSRDHARTLHSRESIREFGVRLEIWGALEHPESKREAILGGVFRRSLAETESDLGAYETCEPVAAGR